MAGIPLEVTLFAVKAILAYVLLNRVPSVLIRSVRGHSIPGEDLGVIAIATTVLLASYGIFGNPFHV